MSGAAFRLALALAAVNVVLVNWAQPIFGRWWQHVMWEGGVIEDLTAVQFFFGAVVFALCAAQRCRGRSERAWLAMYAVVELVLVGEETNYGTGTLFLDLGAPDFATTYNPQRNNLHNLLIEAYIPVLGLVVICFVLRRYHGQIVERLRLPMSRDFLDAVLVTAIGLVFMAPAFFDERFLSIDEVYEWSSSLLLLCMALHFRFGWVFRR